MSTESGPPLGSARLSDESVKMDESGDGPSLRAPAAERDSLATKLAAPAAPALSANGPAAPHLKKDANSNGASTSSTIPCQRSFSASALSTVSIADEINEEMDADADMSESTSEEEDVDAGDAIGADFAHLEARETKGFQFSPDAIFYTCLCSHRRHIASLHGSSHRPDDAIAEAQNLVRLIERRF